MRLLIKLEACKPELTHNYYYPLSAAIYKLLRFGSPEFASFLHEIGFKLNSRKYKLFTFALQFNNCAYLKEHILLKNNSVNLYISSPLIDSFIKNFVIGTFQSQKIEICSDNIKTIFNIRQVECLPEPLFSDTMNFLSLSPMVLSIPQMKNNSMIPKYLRYHEDINEINRVLNNNLLNKYSLLNDAPPSGKEVRLEWDNSYIKRKESTGKKLTALQTIKSGSEQQTKVVGNLLPFKLSGDVDLIKTGYECGFGDMNSMGFGMAEARYSILDA